MIFFKWGVGLFIKVEGNWLGSGVDYFSRKKTQSSFTMNVAQPEPQNPSSIPTRDREVYLLQWLYQITFLPYGITNNIELNTNIIIIIRRKKYIMKEVQK